MVTDDISGNPWAESRTTGDGFRPVILIHGLWLHARSWQPWVELFGSRGYAPIAPPWPRHPSTVEAARAAPGNVADVGIEEAAEHYARIARGASVPPIAVGHAFGGLVAQRLLADGLVAAAVSLDPPPIRGVAPRLSRAQIRATMPVLGNPAKFHRAVSLTEQQFRFGYGNALSAGESRELYQRWAIPSPARPVFEVAMAAFARHSPAAIPLRTGHRGPLLISAGTDDRMVPAPLVRATHGKYRRAGWAADLTVFERRGHSLVVDSGWSQVAGKVLSWLDDQVPDLPHHASHGRGGH